MNHFRVSVSGEQVKVCFSACGCLRITHKKRHLMKVSTVVEREFLFNIDTSLHIFYNMRPSSRHPIYFLTLNQQRPVLSTVLHLRYEWVSSLLRLWLKHRVYNSSKWFVQHRLLKCRRISHWKVREKSLEVALITSSKSITVAQWRQGDPAV